MVNEPPPILPSAVLEALSRGSKIEAIRLLREARGIGLKEAKEEVEACLRDGSAGAFPALEPGARFPAPRVMAAALLLLAAFVWALVNVVDPIGSLIVLRQRDGYRATVFTVEKVLHQDGEDGLFWGFEGRLLEGPDRLYAPTLADARELGYRGLLQRFPAGTEIPVWHNPAVTRTLYQARTLHLIPHTPDLIAGELGRIAWWLKFCLAPLLGTILFLGLLRKMRPLV